MEISLPIVQLTAAPAIICKATGQAYNSTYYFNQVQSIFIEKLRPRYGEECLGLRFSDASILYFIGRAIRWRSLNFTYYNSMYPSKKNIPQGLLRPEKIMNAAGLVDPLRVFDDSVFVDFLRIGIHLHIKRVSADCREAKVPATQLIQFLQNSHDVHASIANERELIRAYKCVEKDLKAGLCPQIVTLYLRGPGFLIHH
jgi:hypothetical protein